ncbi:hypothetical protein BB560_002985 [Smittium megazygosporum]|uniref:Uncharacterized protein n=1 Tax=Smittium megazygosporum TaxID=133381 RepID=A0A2T9ZD82_9FUNG|nr:hypothetical protein BB560_002985 [Smittium megazygosporum]
MRKNKNIDIAKLRDRFALIQSQLKEVIESAQLGNYHSSFEILSKVTKYIVVNCENLGLALESTSFEDFDRPKFWRTFNQCWIFLLERAYVANHNVASLKKGNKNSSKNPEGSLSPHFTQNIAGIQLKNIIVFPSNDVDNLPNNLSSSFQSDILETIFFQIDNLPVDSEDGKHKAIFSEEYIVNLEEKVVSWGESLACYGLVDYEMGFWETDIMDILESIRKMSV